MSGPAAPADDLAGRGDALEDVRDRLVLAQRPLREGVALKRTSRFGDPAWDLAPALLQARQSSARLDFPAVPEPLRLVVKQLCWSMLSGPLPAYEPRPKVMSIRRLMVELVRFTTWVAGRAPAAPRLSTLSLADLGEYAVHLHDTVGSASTNEVAQVAVRLFWRYRTVLDADHLTVDPKRAAGWGGSTRRGGVPGVASIGRMSSSDLPAGAALPIRQPSFAIPSSHSRPESPKSRHVAQASRPARHPCLDSRSLVATPEL